MKNSKVLFLDLVNRIKINENAAEIRTIAYLIMEHVFSLTRNEILLEKEVESGRSEDEKINEIIRRINSNEPVQYVTGETMFYGRMFRVNSSVLIPRPETEELVRFVVTFLKENKAGEPVSIMDIGTGSGCIPVTLALEFPLHHISATDISAAALEVARMNALALKAPVRFFEHDILTEKIPLDGLDVVVSNPPYITPGEKESMKENVLAFEPHLALFVPENDPLLFYKAIAGKASMVLRPGGLLAMEINECFGKDIAALFKSFDFQDVEVISDLSGKDRMVKGIQR